MSFATLIESDSTTLAEIEAHLERLSADVRVAEAQALSGAQQARLWTLAAGASKLTLDELMPPQVSSGQTVIFAGKNSLPTFNRFEKRFQRLGGQVFGYNHQTMSFATGPGYFTVVPAPNHENELLFDYTRVPPTAPDGWPPVRSNSSGLSRLVYKDLHDYMRRVSTDVIIGSATRLGKPMNSYFVLARR